MKKDINIYDLSFINKKKVLTEEDINIGIKTINYYINNKIIFSDDIVKFIAKHHLYINNIDMTYSIKLTNKLRTFNPYLKTISKNIGALSYKNGYKIKIFKDNIVDMCKVIYKDYDKDNVNYINSYILTCIFHELTHINQYNCYYNDLEVHNELEKEVNEMCKVEFERGTYTKSDSFLEYNAITMGFIKGTMFIDKYIENFDCMEGYLNIESNAFNIISEFKYDYTIDTKSSYIKNKDSKKIADAINKNKYKPIFNKILEDFDYIM